MIHQELGVSRGTLSYWFCDKPFVPNKEALGRIKAGPAKAAQVRSAKRLRQIAEMRATGVADVGELSLRDLFMIGVGLYIGEGSKTTEAIRLVNADPEVIKLYIHWLRQVCGLCDENITISLHLYPDTDVDVAKAYWRKVTNLPAESFRWVSIDRRSNKSKSNAGKLPHGTAHVTVRANGDRTKGVQLFRQIDGWMKAVLHQV